MIKPLDLNEIGEFLQMCLFAFDDYIFITFVLMITFAVALGVRRLLYWGF